MWLVIEDHDNLFIMAEFVHFAGIGMLLYKLFSKKNAGGKLLRYAGCRSEQLLLLSFTYSYMMDHILSFRSVSKVTGADCAVFGDKAVLQVSPIVCQQLFMLHVMLHHNAGCL